MPPLRRTRICSPRPSASTMTAHSLKAIRTETNYPLPRRKSRVRPHDGGDVALCKGMIGSGAGDCAPAPSHTTGRAVFRIWRLDRAECFHLGPAHARPQNPPMGSAPSERGLVAGAAADGDVRAPVGSDFDVGVQPVFNPW